MTHRRPNGWTFREAGGTPYCRNAGQKHPNNVVDFSKSVCVCLLHWAREMTAAEKEATKELGCFLDQIPVTIFSPCVVDMAVRS